MPKKTKISRSLKQQNLQIHKTPKSLNPQNTEISESLKHRYPQILKTPKYLLSLSKLKHLNFDRVNKEKCKTFKNGATKERKRTIKKIDQFQQLKKMSTC